MGVELETLFGRMPFEHALSLSGASLSTLLQGICLCLKGALTHQPNVLPPLIISSSIIQLLRVLCMYKTGATIPPHVTILLSPLSLESLGKKRRRKNTGRVQNCPDITILNSLFGLCLFVFMSFCLYVFLSNV